MARGRSPRTSEVPVGESPFDDKPKKTARRARASTGPITSETHKEVSGIINPQGEAHEDIEDLRHLVTEDTDPINDNGAVPPTEPAPTPRRKRAPRIEISSADLSKKLEEEKKAAAEAKQRRMAEMAKRVDQAMETKETEEEESWFKQGEDSSHVASLAERQREEDARGVEDVRRSIAEAYDTKKSETIIETDEELDAATKQAETMLANGELNPEVFNVKDYRYQLMEKARLDRELETAGWWQARKLRAELKETLKNLEDYEQQLASVASERASAKDAARKTAPDYEEIEVSGYRPPSGPTMKPGSGTYKKPGFFARLFKR